MHIGQPPPPHNPAFLKTWPHIKLYGKFGQRSTVQLASLRNDNAPHPPVLVVGGRTLLISTNSSTGTTSTSIRTSTTTVLLELATSYYSL